MKQIILPEIEQMKNMLKSISIKLNQRLCMNKENSMSLVESQGLQQFNDVAITKCIQESCKVRIITFDVKILFCKQQQNKMVEKPYN